MRRLLLAPLLLLASLTGANAAATCNPFTSFPLVLNFGSGVNTGTGEDLNCAMRKTQAAVNALPALRGVPGGIATLGTDGRLVPAQLPDVPSISSLPRVNAATAGGVAADGVTDQAANLLLAASKVPAAGGILVLPCGQIAHTNFTLNNQNLIVEGGGQYCTTLVSLQTTGDAVTLAGNYSGIRDVGFTQKNASITRDSSNNPTAIVGSRTSGSTVNMKGAYQFVERASFQYCFICIRMGTLAGYSRVSMADMTNLTPEANAAGSGGIVVDNPAYGPNNWIDHVLAYSGQGNAALASTFGIQLGNTGATNIGVSDILGFKTNLLINPSSGKTVQATFVHDTYLDSAQGDNVLLAPTGTGFIFTTRFSQTWLTNTTTANTNGLRIVTTGATGNSNYPVMDTRFDNGFIISTASVPGTGFLVNDSGATDTSITGTLVAGWNIGVNIGTNVTDVTVAGNSIGKFSPFGQAANSVGLAMTSGSGDRILVKGNRLTGNGTAIIDQNPAGVNNFVIDNVGYNGSQPATAVAVTASPMAIRNGKSPATYYINGGTAVSVVAPGGNVALASQSPAVINLGPNEQINVSYSSAPTIARMPH